MELRGTRYFSTVRKISRSEIENKITRQKLFLMEISYYHQCEVFFPITCV